MNQEDRAKLEAMFELMNEAVTRFVPDNEHRKKALFHMEDAKVMCDVAIGAEVANG